MEIGKIIAGIIAPFFYPVASGQRIFLLYLGTALILAVLVYWTSRKRHSGRGWRDVLAYLFPKKIFKHRSAKLDYKYFIINKGAVALLFGPFIIGSAGAAESTRALLAAALDSSTALALAPGPMAPVWLTLLSLLAMDAAIFGTHYLQHKVSLLWEFHKVHHSAEVLTPITIYRMHPVDIIFTASMVGLGVGGVQGVFRFLYGGTVGEITVLSVNLFLFAFYVFGYNLRHTHVWLSYPKMLSHIFVSPAQHQIHHSKEPRHFDRNMGFMFAFWDWMAGTLYVPDRHERFAMGLDKDEHLEYDSVWHLYSVPFVKTAALLRPHRTRLERDRRESHRSS